MEVVPGQRVNGVLTGVIKKCNVKRKHLFMFNDCIWDVWLTTTGTAKGVLGIELLLCDYLMNMRCLCYYLFILEPYLPII